ncbi:hypothetical protein R6Q57_023682 [Mikania cordata]
MVYHLLVAWKIKSMTLAFQLVVFALIATSSILLISVPVVFASPDGWSSNKNVVFSELADAYSPDTVISSSPGKEVHDPWAFYLHATFLRQAFAHCGKFPTAASRRILGRVSVPVWLIILSDQLLIIALVLHEEDLAQRVLFDTGRRRTRPGIMKIIEEAEPSQDDTDQPLFCAKDLTISDGTGVPSLFHFYSRVLMCFHAPLRP